jgi:hypothetical protein
MSDAGFIPTRIRGSGPFPQSRLLLSMLLGLSVVSYTCSHSDKGG